MNIAELRERSTADLQQLQQELARDLWKSRFGNYTNQLDDTAKIKRVRRTIAQINTLVTERALGLDRTPKRPVDPEARRDHAAKDEEKKAARAKKAAEVVEEEVEESEEEEDDTAIEAPKAKKAAKAKGTKAKAEAAPKKKTATKAKAATKSPAKKTTKKGEK